MIVAGFGFREGARVESLRDALARCGAEPGALATAAAKSAHPALVALAREMQLPVAPVSARDLCAQNTLTLSENARAAHGTGSVAEAAALAAAGPNARLTGQRLISTDRMATCAIAIGETP